jgi:hypothetical protein
MDLAYKELVSALRLVALPFEAQQNVLPKFVGHADEVALIFDDALKLFGGPSAKLMPERTAQLLIELDELFDQMSGRKDL